MASALRKVQADRVDTETGALCVAQPGDLLAVLRVLAQGDPSGALPASASHAERGTWAHMMRTEGMMVHVAEADGRVVGTATLLVMPNLTYQCAPTEFIGAVVPGDRDEQVPDRDLQSHRADSARWRSVRVTDGSENCAGRPDPSRCDAVGQRRRARTAQERPGSSRRFDEHQFRRLLRHAAARRKRPFDR